MHKFTGFQPMHSGGVDSHSLLSGEIRAVLQVIMLSFMLGFEIQTRQSPQVLLADRFIDSGTSPDTFSIEIRSVGPPISLALHVT